MLQNTSTKQRAKARAIVSTPDSPGSEPVAAGGTAPLTLDPRRDHWLIVLPDDTVRPIIEAIDTASSSLNVCMFVLDDPLFLQALIRAKRRGVDVRVMLNRHRRNGELENERAWRLLGDAGVEVRASSQKFELTHEKSLVVDDEIGFIQSMNWDGRRAQTARDYAIVTRNPQETKEMTDCFDADWNEQSFSPKRGSRLIWCPDNGRPRIAAFIDGAVHSLWVQNERYQDTVIIERLVRASLRGVKVHILTSPPHRLKSDHLNEGIGGLRILQDVGIKVHVAKHVKLHAKMMIADGRSAIIGSINLTPGSFNGRRELAIETSDELVVERIHAVAQQDWMLSRKLDLTDSGLQRELVKHARTSTDGSIG